MKSDICIRWDSETMESKEYKRKPARQYRKLDLICVVCDGIAHGYNFDAISCESCKAFFRRNALQPSGKLKCRNNNKCNVKFDQRKRCKKCRLTKCFSAGMRKEWILTPEERQAKRIKIEENRRSKQNLVPQQFPKTEPTDNYNLLLTLSNRVYLTQNDLLKVQLLQNAYTKAVKLNQTTGILQYPLIQPIESTYDLFRMPIFISSMRLITFFKQIPEFQKLDKDEQVYLVKLNTLSIAFLHSIFIYDTKNATYHEQDTNDPLFLEKDWINTINKEFHDIIKQIRCKLCETIQIDDEIIKIFFLITLFSSHFTLKSSSSHICTLNIFKAQNIYSELFWKYSLHYYGFENSSKLFLQFTTGIVKLQKLIDELKSTVSNYTDITKLSPLMQSLL
ncbi:unnamed protein product [Adineta steineri]|uniref:Nuclear receptor n=1 Tax=Adineta steineri TaxID=433720 RepID=A0A815CTN3_9BILA|nr:unnamed protein product [Adineta steineri]CAF1536455.1 unnamed protein product [Adineta steineri]